MIEIGLNINYKNEFPKYIIFLKFFKDFLKIF